MVARLSQPVLPETELTVLAAAAGSISTTPMITATPATNLPTSLLRHRRADLGTFQVEPHWARVLVDSCGKFDSLQVSRIVSRYVTHACRSQVKN